MLVNVFPPSRGAVREFQARFALQQDNWNDYSFQTLYGLSYKPDDPTDDPVFLGGAKILKLGQTENDGIQIRDDFDALSPEFCSVGTSLDYYQRLNSLPPEDRQAILSALRDVVATPSLQAEFSGERGWRISLFRDMSAPEDFLADAAAILSGNFASLPDLDFKFSFKIEPGSTELDFDFDAPEPDFYLGRRRRIGPSQRRVLLPRRIMVLIGRNGSGKSTLLSRMARIAFASADDRDEPELRELGAFNPAAIGFMRIIAISYSAFDSFIVPGIFEKDLRQIARDIEKGEGRYVYCGLRDIVAEARADLSKAEATADDSNKRRKIGSADRRTSTLLKSVDQLADEFHRLIQRIRAASLDDLFESALEPLLSDPSFSDLIEPDPEVLLGSDPRTAFLSWSAGHKIALHVVASLVAYAKRKSLILFDEPETHLHPPLTAALMHSVRIVLEEVNAFALVATHSPVVLQETLAHHVRVIRRFGDSFEIRQPSMETFGENVGILTYDTFGLTASTTDFHEILDLLIEGSDTTEEIDALFTPSLSGQARAYVMAGFAAKRGKD